MKAATEQFLESCTTEETLDEQSNTLRGICERAIRKGLGNRAVNVSSSEAPAAEAETNTVFSMLWAIAWPARFPGDLVNLIAGETFDAISNDLKDAAKRALTNTL